MRSKINLIGKKKKSSGSHPIVNDPTLIEYIKERLEEDEHRVNEEAYERAKRSTENM